MNLLVFIPLLFTLQLFYWAVGKRASKNLKDSKDYFLAGKSVSFFPLMMTFLATQVGGGLVLGASDEAYRYGWPVLLYPLGASLGLILLGSPIGRRLAQLPVSTVAQIFEIVYRSPSLRKIASLLSIISLFMILVAQVIATQKFLLSLGISSTPLFVTFWAIVILYTAQGGLKAVISTDLVQALLFSGVFFCSFGYILIAHPIPQQVTEFALSSSKLWGWLLMPLLFMVIEQDMAQRCFAGNSAKTVTKAAFWAGIFTFIICFIPIFLGVMAKSLGLFIPAGASVLMTAVEALTNPTFAALVGCAILAAIISTATSLISAIGSNLANDFTLPFSLRFTKVCTALISLSAIFFAFYFDNIVDILIQSYELSLSCLFVPIVVALFKKSGNFLSALLSILFGAAAFTLFHLFPTSVPREPLSLLLSTSGYLLGELYLWQQKKVA